VTRAGVVSALDYDLSMTDNRFENLSLLAPEKHSNAIADPTGTIPHVGVLGWVEQVCKRAIRRMRWKGPLRDTAVQSY
jgi:hypothetical protein